jgi:hypothetical protein
MSEEEGICRMIFHLERWSPPTRNESVDDCEKAGSPRTQKIAGMLVFSLSHRIKRVSVVLIYSGALLGLPTRSSWPGIEFADDSIGIDDIGCCDVLAVVNMR